MENNVRSGARAPLTSRRAAKDRGTKGIGVRKAGVSARGGTDGRLIQAENDRLYTLLEFSTLLSSTRGIDPLLKILALQTSSLMRAERTSIFIYDPAKGELWSKVAEGTGRKVLRVPADRGIIGLVIRKGKVLNVADAYRHPAFNPDVDKQTGFRTRTILAAPMRSRSGGTTGVIEVLNKKSGPFTVQDEKMLLSIASLAAVAIENSFLIESQRSLFESFVESSIHALGERDRITYGHTIRVAFYADQIARAVSDCVRPPFKSIHYSEEDLKKLRFAALLHDIGKIGVPEAILNKRDKLDPHEVESIRTRFEHIKLAEKIRALEDGGLNLNKYRLFCHALDTDLQLILAKLSPGPVTDEETGRLDRMRQTIFKIGDLDVPQLSESEFQHLTLRRGNLTEDEFKVMKDHVKKTWEILGKIHWPGDLKEIPFWAATHHERPNGTGYPHGLKGDEIPLEGQILAVADIFDALTAADRPYKKRMPLEEAKSILRKAAEVGQVNKYVVELFLEQHIERMTPPGIHNPFPESAKESDSRRGKSASRNPSRKDP